jgi:hypothetical protein
MRVATIIGDYLMATGESMSHTSTFMHIESAMRELVASERHKDAQAFAALREDCEDYKQGAEIEARLADEARAEVARLQAENARAFSVIADKDNIPQAIAELLHKIANGRTATTLAIDLAGKPLELCPESTEALAASLYRALVNECGITAKISLWSERANYAEAEVARLREERDDYAEDLKIEAGLVEEARAERDALRERVAELEKYQNTVIGLLWSGKLDGLTCGEITAEAEKVKSQLEAAHAAARRDAERLDWLEASLYTLWASGLRCGESPPVEISAKAGRFEADSIRAAIDAAMQREAGK